MYQLIPLHSCDYLKKISIKTNVATDEGNSRNEMWLWTNDEIGVAVQSWLWLLVELMSDSSVSKSVFFFPFEQITHLHIKLTKKLRK